MSKQIILIVNLFFILNVSAQNDFKAENLSQGVCQDCENLLYGFNKATGLQALSINNATSAEAIGQYYNAPQAITVHGVDFYAYQETANPINIAIEIYLADVDFLPTGAPLASKAIAFSGDLGMGTLDELRSSVLFDVPVTVTEPYIIVLSNPNAESVAVISNNYNATPPDGQGEFLASVKIGPDWFRGPDVNIGGVPFDADVLLEPLVSYSLETDFIITPAQDDGSHFVSLENNSSPVLLDRMYNQAVFVNLEDESHQYDLGDGTEITGPNATHTYAGSGIYTITKSDTLFGWQRDLTSSSSQAWGTGMVAGQLTGLLTGNEITVQNNSDQLTLTANGAFAFAQPLNVGDKYTVNILAEPNDPIQPCTVTNETGTITNQDITNVLVSCEAGDDLIFRDGF
jgi:hypothetical protein